MNALRSIFRRLLAWCGLASRPHAEQLELPLQITKRRGR